MIQPRAIAIGSLGVLAFLAARASLAAAPASARAFADTEGGQGGLFDEVVDAGVDLKGSLTDGMRMSSMGLDLLKKLEGFRSSVYLDSAGLPTIGYGHLIAPGEDFGVVTEAQASQMLAADVRTAENAVNGLVSIALDQFQFDALVSFVFNIGAGAFRKSTLLRKLNDGDRSARDEFGRWVYVTVDGQKVASPGLVARRQAESRLFQGFSV